MIKKKAKQVLGNYTAIQSGDIRYRDEYGKWFMLLSHKATKKLLETDNSFKIIGDTYLNKANKDTGIIINGFRYNISKRNLLRKCIGYIPCDNKSIIRLTKPFELPKVIISLMLILGIALLGFNYLNNDGILEMMLNKVAYNTEFRDSFDYTDRVVILDDTLEIANNTYNPVTLQYIIYDGVNKIFDSGLLRPGDTVLLNYGTYLKAGEHSLKIKTVAKSLDGLKIISNTTKDLKLTTINS